jgi:HD-GYP domain-containing protein (c-di-GMP phosphodiesterase class II)
MLTTVKRNIKFLVETPLYLQQENGGFKLIKRAGITTRDAGIILQRLPSRLFIQGEHKNLALQEIHNGLKAELSGHLRTKNLKQVKTTIVDFMHETLTHPSIKSLEEAPSLVNLMLKEFLAEPQVLRKIASLTVKDYSTAVHATNVMSLALCFGIKLGYTHHESRTLGLAAMLHDVGKLHVPASILRSDHSLTDREFDRRWRRGDSRPG